MQSDRWLGSALLFPGGHALHGSFVFVPVSSVKSPAAHDSHDALGTAFPLVPAGQGVHSCDAASEKYPSAQSSHWNALVADANLPASHAWQSPEAPVELMKNPALHASQVVRWEESCMPTKPIGHSPHMVWPVACVYRPSPHALHFRGLSSVEPRYCPNAHPAQAMPLLVPYRPAGQRAHLTLPLASEDSPIPQSEQRTAPESAATWPMSHLWHAVNPVVLANLPGMQAKH